MPITRFEQGKRMSQAVACQGLVFLAGQVPKERGGDIRAQTADVLSSIDGLLRQAGADRQTLLSATVWLADMQDFGAMNEVWESWVVPGHLPVRACVQAALAFPEYRVEIAVIAAISG